VSRLGPYGLFDAIGIELEYMIVDRETLDVRPVADELLKKVGGGYEKDVAFDGIAWSNELALHVLEMKTNGPVPALAGVAERFQEGVAHANALLGSLGSRLLPGGMHPWMDAHAELRLWPHEDRTIYETLHRIFDCRGHGWANLQSMHINLPFADDEEFGRLHAAVRLVLPILPALAASSPYADGRATGFLDTRMEVYRRNSDRVPSAAGKIVPERVFTKRAYETELLSSIYEEMAPLDPEGVLRYEWINARGAIARFDRGAIEIRVLDIQECPRADLAIAFAVIAVVRALVEERICSFEEQKAWDEAALAAIFLDAIRDADRSVVRDPGYLRALGLEAVPSTAGDVWRRLVERVVSREEGYAEWRDALETIVERGTLARRMIERAGCEPDRASLKALAGEMSGCLQEGRLLGASV